MPSVTPDTAISSNYAPPRQKAARDESATDQSQFSTLIDSNTSARIDDRPALPDPAPPRRAADASDAPRNDSRSNSASTRRRDDRYDQPDDNNNDGPADATAAPADVKQDGAAKKAGKDKSDSAASKTAPDAAKSDTPTADVAANATIVTEAAVAPAVAIVTPASPQPAPTQPAIQAAAATAASGPLSIAAAAIAATASTIQAAKPTPTTDTTASADASASPSDPQLAAAVAAATSVAGKPAIKASLQAAGSAGVAAPKTTEASIAASGTTDAAVTSAGSPEHAAHAAATAKPVSDSADSEKAASATPDTTAIVSAAPATSEHRTTAQAQPASIDIGTPSQAIPQTQLQAPTASLTTAAQYTVVASTTAAVPLNGVGVEIAASAKSGKTSFEIRLDPAELGRIDVRLEVDRHGNVTSHLTVEKPETLTMLRQDAPQLHRALNDAGLKTSDGALQFSLGDQSPSSQNSNGNNGGENGRQPQRLVIREDDALPPALAAGRSYGRALASRSGVDISI